MSELGDRSVLGLVDAVSILFMHAYVAARARALGHPSSIVRILAQRDHAHSDAVLLERELAIFRSHRQSRPAKRRPYYSPQERAEILQLMRLRGWSAKETAARFVVHPNTIRNWKKAQLKKHKTEDAVGTPPWNRLHAGVRWLVHEIRSLCPERDFGTLTIARHIIRAGIQISRASVRRILEEERPLQPKACTSIGSALRTAPEHFFKPPRPNHVWHMDMTVFRVLWMRFEVAAIIDGFSRKIMSLKVFHGSPTTVELVDLIDISAKRSATPKYVVTDRGGQFQRAFRHALRARGIQHARGRGRTWQFNAKVERLFWSLKRWWRLSLIVPSTASIQKHLDAYAIWHNLYRPHEALGKLTPSEAASGISVPEPVRYTEGGEFEPTIRIKRQHIGDDPRLLYPAITVKPKHRSAA
ncbi:MAG: DDE-type integrase/transposase/recombinase [Planctomycetota bacterium]